MAGKHHLRAPGHTGIGAIHALWMIVALCLGRISPAEGQCAISASAVIPDDDVLTFQFNVSGLVDGNLSSPTQGICGVQIDFMHEYLGDLTVSLISPAGTRVELIGPPTTATAPTNLSRWNIGFVPCGTPAAPDAGFSAMWSNLQAWQVLTPYSGTYHPQSGCLEDFNTGPANGIWQIIVEDHDALQVGTIASLTLIFCNPAGLMCSECAPNAGVMSPPSFTICSGENIQSSDISIDFGGMPPLPANYGYAFVMTSGNTILQSGSSFSITPLAGQYSICGLSYVLTDQVDIDNLLSSGDYDLLTQAVGSGLVCADLTDGCVTLNVMPRPDTVRVSTQLCNGESFVYGGQSYGSEGLFYQLHDGPGLCDTIHEIRITPRPLAFMLNVPDTISCGAGPVSLMAMTSGASGPFTYLWTTQSGQIIPPANASSVMVNQPGVYTVSVSDGICEGLASVEVHADQGYPQVLLSGGTITCTNPSLTLMPVYVPSDAVISWMGPGGFTSSQPVITISQGGNYTFRVTNQAGCTTTETINVAVDTSTHLVSIVPLTKNCQNATLELSNSDDLHVTGWFYTGPNGFMTNYWRPLVTDAGLYTLTATFRNGCTRMATYFFDGDFMIPDISISPEDTLNCNEVIPLMMSSSVPGVTYQWTGPQGFSSSASMIQIDEPGTYSGVVYAPNGCQAGSDVMIAQGGDVFSFQVMTDTISCARDSVFIGVIAPEADIYNWLNFSGPDSMEAFIHIGSPGTYMVTMLDTNSGCEVVTRIQVPGDFALPQYSYTVDTITCLQPVAQLQFVPVAGQSYQFVQWQFPDLTTTTDIVISSNMPGQHRLIVVNDNGCIGQSGVHIPFDTITPVILLESDTLTCADTVRLQLQSLDSIYAYQWTGPGILLQNDLGADVILPGWYHVEASGENGCPARGDVFVDSNFVAPVFTLLSDSLRCDSFATLSVMSTEPGLTFAWFDPSGTQFSTNSLVEVMMPGTYQVDVMGVNRCISSDSVFLTPLTYPALTLASDTLTCTQFTAQLLATTDASATSFAWFDLSGMLLGTSTSLIVQVPGPFVAEVTAANACTVRDTIQVPYDTMPPVAMITMIGEVRCQQRDFILDGALSTPDPLLYSWSTLGGQLLGDPGSPTIQAQDTGVYTLVVEGFSNGCRDTAMIHVTDHPDAITSVSLSVTPTQCSGEGNAVIELNQVNGGIGPFLFELNGSPPQTQAVFSGLQAGTYLMTVIDMEGCRYDTTVTIAPNASFTVDAGPDEDIHLGEMVVISGTTDLAASEMFNEQWDTLQGPVCSACPSVEVGPYETTAYVYSVTSITGCVRSDTLIVYVFERGKFYVPNVFSPNGDQINDEIRFFASPGIEKVIKWIIFDRWGNAVYGYENFTPGDPLVFWDGRTSTGDEPNPGVYAYIAEIQLINGKIEVHHGDITLVR